MENHLVITKKRTPEAMRYLPLAAATAILLAASACAQPPRPQPVWISTPSATAPKDQAAAKCEYDLMQNRAAFDNLSVMAGQPRLNDYGRTLYQTCMRSQGYQFGGMVPAVGSAQ